MELCFLSVTDIILDGNATFCMILMLSRGIIHRSIVLYYFTDLFLPFLLATISIRPLPPVSKNLLTNLHNSLVNFIDFLKKILIP